MAYLLPGILVRCNCIMLPGMPPSDKTPFYNPVFLVSTILDPNYQLLWVDEELSLLSQAEREEFRSEAIGMSWVYEMYSG